MLFRSSGYPDDNIVNDERFKGERMEYMTPKEYNKKLYDILTNLNPNKNFIPVVSHGGIIEHLTGVKVGNTGIVAYKPDSFGKDQIHVVYDGVKKIKGGGRLDKNCKPQANDCWKSQIKK